MMLVVEQIQHMALLVRWQVAQITAHLPQAVLFSAFIKSETKSAKSSKSCKTRALARITVLYRQRWGWCSYSNFQTNWSHAHPIMRMEMKAKWWHLSRKSMCSSSSWWRSSCRWAGYRANNASIVIIPPSLNSITKLRQTKHLQCSPNELHLSLTFTFTNYTKCALQGSYLLRRARYNSNSSSHKLRPSLLFWNLVIIIRRRITNTPTASTSLLCNNFLRSDEKTLEAPKKRNASIGAKQHLAARVKPRSQTKPNLILSRMTLSAMTMTTLKTSKSNCHLLWWPKRIGPLSVVPLNRARWPNERAYMLKSTKVRPISCRSSLIQARKQVIRTAMKTINSKRWFRGIVTPAHLHTN